MEWLTYNEFVARGLKIHGIPIPQYIELPANVDELSTSIPVEPQSIEQGDIAAAPCQQWHGIIGDRAFLLEQEKGLPQGPRVFVITSYLDRQNTLGDWSALAELLDLSGAIQVMRPNFISSRTNSPAWTVFRPDSSSTGTPLYNSVSRQDAENCLSFLLRDSYNEKCDVRPYSGETRYWSAIQTDNTGQEIVLGNRFMSRDTAIAFASEVSARNPNASICIRACNPANRAAYRSCIVSCGRVVECE